MAERELAIIIRARDLASKTIGTVKREMGGLGKAGAQAAHGLSTAITRIGAAAAVGLAGGIAFGIRSLVDLQRTTEQTNAVIASTGGKAGVTAVQVRALAQSLEDLTTVDDKVIQDGENMLLTFTGISSKVFPQATKAALNMAVAMAKGDVSQVDMKASSIQLGKALNDPIKGITALRKVGVAFNDQQIKQIKTLVKHGDTLGAQKIILKELEVEFGKAGAAAGKGPGATWRRLQDVGEGLSQSLARGLLPLLERVGNFLSTKLADPTVTQAIDDIGTGLANAAQQGLDFIQRVDFHAVGEALKTARDAAGGLVSVFMGMPDWVKTAVITGWGLNKLTGGALTGLLGGVIKGVLGMTAAVVNIKAGAVTGVGGLPVGVAGAGGTAGLLGGILGIAMKAFTVITVAEIADLIHEQIKAPPDIPASQLSWPWGPLNTPTILPGLPFVGPNGILGGSPAVPDAGNDSGALHNAGVSDRGLDSSALHQASQTATGDLGDLATQARRAALGLESVKLRGGLDRIIAGITGRSAAAHGGHALGAGAIDRTFQRDLLHEVKMVERRGGTQAQKLDALRRLQHLAISHKDYGVAAKISRAIAHKKMSVNVTTNTSVQTNISSRDVASSVVRSRSRAIPI